MEEQDAQVDLLRGCSQHARDDRAATTSSTARPRPLRRARAGRAREPVQRRDGTYRGPSTQQGYSPFTTWTRGLAWAMLGFAEQLEFLATLPAADDRGVAATHVACLLEAARATCDFYIDIAAAPTACPYWDTGAPGLAALGDWGNRARRSVQRSRAGRQLRRRDRGAGPAAARRIPGSPRRGAARGTGRPG